MNDEQRARVRAFVEGCDMVGLNRYTADLVLTRQARGSEIAMHMVAVLDGADQHVRAHWLDETCPCCSAESN